MGEAEILAWIGSRDAHFRPLRYVSGRTTVLLEWWDQRGHFRSTEGADVRDAVLGAVVQEAHD